MNNGMEFDNLLVRPVRKEEVEQWNTYMKAYHYLGLKWMSGESLRYIAVLNGEWVALLGWGSASKNCGVRERYIGWSGEKKYKRLCFITNNTRFLILPWVSQKNLASKILSLNLKRLSKDFEIVYGHPVYLAETFVDESRYKGTCYKASNWDHVGYTLGYGRSNRRYHHHGNVKAVYLYSLYKRAREVLSGTLIPYNGALLKEKKRLETMIKFPIEKLLSRIREFTDPRGGQGKRYGLEAVLSISICAVLCGCKGYRAIGAWAQSLSKEELIRFGINRSTAPSETAIRRLIQRIDADAFDREIGKWLLDERMIESGEGKGYAIAIDGKTLRRSYNADKKEIHLLSAVIHKEGVIIGQEEVGKKTNEINHVIPLLKNLNIENCVVTADALHTQKKLANYLTEEKKADYVFTVKENQNTLLKDIQSVLKKTTNPPRIIKPPIKAMDE